MFFSRLLADPPEIAHLPWQERASLIREAQQRMDKGGVREWLAIWAVWCFLGIGLASYSVVMIAMRAPLEVFTYTCGLPLVVTILLMTIFAMSYNSSLKAALRELCLEKHIRPTRCFCCGHNLQGTESSKCPECEADLVKE